MQKTPILCEPGMIYFLKGSLKECKKFRDSHSTLLFNIMAGGLFLAGLGGLLWYKYKGKLTPEEEARKRRETHSYLINKLQQYSAIRNNRSQDMITDLPAWDRRVV